MFSLERGAWPLRLGDARSVRRVSGQNPRLPPSWAGRHSMLACRSRAVLLGLGATPRYPDCYSVQRSGRERLRGFALAPCAADCDVLVSSSASTLDASGGAAAARPISIRLLLPGSDRRDEAGEHRAWPLAPAYGIPPDAQKDLFFGLARLIILSRSLMILPQVHLRKPCYDFYFL